MEPVRALDRGLEILLCLAQESREIGPSELSNLLAMPNATVIRLARTLEARKFIKQNPQTGAYSLGVTTLQLSDSFIAQLDFRKVCCDCMEELRDKTNESVSLYTAEGDKRICIDRVDSRDTRVPIIKIGYLVPINIGAAGKVLLAFASTRGNTYGVKESELSQTRKQGYSISHSERVNGVTAIAVPIFNNKSQLVCSISINGSSEHFEGEKMDFFIKETIKTGKKASSMLGYICK